MANRRRVNPLQPQVSLTRTKQYDNKTPYTKLPYDRPQRNYIPRGLGPETVIPLTHNYPRESAGYFLGDIINKTVTQPLMERRANQKYDREAQAYNQAHDDVLRQMYNSKYGNPQPAVQEVSPLENSIIGDPQGWQKAKLWNDSLAQYQQEPNKTQVEIDNAKMAQEADQYRNMDLSQFSDRQIQDFINQRVDSGKGSAAYKKNTKQQLYKEMSERAAQSAQQAVQGMWAKYLKAATDPNTTPEQLQKMQQEMYEMHDKFNSLGRGNIAQSLLQPMAQDYALSQEMKKQQAVSNMKYNDAVRLARWNIDNNYGSGRLPSRGRQPSDVSYSPSKSSKTKEVNPYDKERERLEKIINSSATREDARNDALNQLSNLNEADLYSRKDFGRINDENFIYKGGDPNNGIDYDKLMLLCASISRQGKPHSAIQRFVDGLGNEFLSNEVANQVYLNYK